LTRVFDNKVALYIPELDIPRGEMIVILGKSGCGKTTFLETIGMLSQAHSKRVTDSQIVYYPFPDQPGYDYRDIWLDKRKLNKLRLDYISFMFQRSHLIPMFSVWQNVATTKIMQGYKGEDYSAQKKDLDEFDLLIQKIIGISSNKEVIEFGNKTVNTLSCGMQQRISFARSIAKNFKVLFADEPTGNIDPTNAHWVMTLIRRHIDQSVQAAKASGQLELLKTAILVTHNLDLAIAYADRLMVMNQNGYIDEKLVFSCDKDTQGNPIYSESSKYTDEFNNKTDYIIYQPRSWSQLGKTVSEITLTLENKMLDIFDYSYIGLNNKSERIIVKKEGSLLSNEEVRKDRWGSSMISSKNDHKVTEVEDVLKTDDMPNMPRKYDSQFNKLFLNGNSKDLKLFSGRGFFLLGMLFVVFLAIGFGQGGLDVLNDKMNDPFVRWLDVSIPHGMTDQLDFICDSLNSSRIKDKYMVEWTTSYTKFSKTIWNEKINDGQYAIGRTLAINDPLIDKLTNAENLIAGGSFKKANSLGWILSEDYVKTCCDSQKPAFVNIIYPSKYQVEVIPVPVIGIVKKLPGNAKFITLPFFYDQYLAPSHPLDPSKTDQLIIFVEVAQDTAWEIKNKLEAFFIKKDKGYGYYGPTISSPIPYDESWKSGFQIRVTFWEAVDLKFLRNTMNDIKSDPLFKNYRLIQMFKFFENTVGPFPQDNSLSIYMNNLEKLADFSEYCSNNHQLEINMEKVEAMSNYNLIASLTRVLGYTIILISIISISIFISNVMRELLNQHRIYIGIFTAFGIMDETIQMLYLRLIGPFIFINLIIALGLSIIIGYSGLLKDLFIIMGLFQHENHTFFNLKNNMLLFFIVILLISSISSAFFSAKSFLDHCPGDLIYDRIGKDKRTSPTISAQKARTVSN